MKWPGRDSPGKGRFPAWHRADPSCQQDSGTITGSPALGPGGDPPRTPSAAGGRVVPQHLLTPTPLPRGHPSWGQATPLPPLPAQSVMQFLHKSTRRRKKQNDKRCPGPMPATWHSGNIGKVGPNGPSLPPNGRRRRPGTPGCPSAQRWSVRRAPLCVCTRTGTPTSPPPRGDGAFLCRASTEPGEIHCPHADGTGQLRAGWGSGHGPGIRGTHRLSMTCA